MALMDTVNKLAAKGLSGYACKLPTWVDALPAQDRADTIALIGNRLYSSEVVRQALSEEYGFPFGAQVLRNHRNGTCRHCIVSGRTW